MERRESSEREYREREMQRNLQAAKLIKREDVKAAKQTKREDVKAVKPTKREDVRPYTQEASTESKSCERERSPVPLPIPEEIEVDMDACDDNTHKLNYRSDYIPRRKEDYPALKPSLGGKLPVQLPDNWPQWGKTDKKEKEVGKEVEMGLKKERERTLR